MINRTLSHYRIIEKLGVGGMGVVYKAQDQRLNRLVALKVLPSDKVSDAERRRRFIQEARAASALNHPNIVTIYDIDDADNEHFIAMEYVPGKTLGQLIGRKGLPLKDVLNYSVQIADALAKAHSAGIIHRDLKPANIMVNDNGQVKILDFGLAKLSERSGVPDENAPTVAAVESPLTAEGIILGTAAYMSPEQAQGKPIDARSDIFSFGSVLYEMITGRRPFAGETTASTLAAILNIDPPLPGEISATLPVEVEQLVMRCLRKEPQRRLQTMSDLKVLLQDLKEESDSGKLLAARPMPAPRKSKRWMLLAVSALFLVATVAGVVWYFLPQTSDSNLPQVERLTYESGIAIWPTISGDGKLVAYAADHAGAYDIYVRQINSRQAIRRTQHEANDWKPCFSPDGSKIAFRSERDGGGLYIMDSLVGPEQKIADAGDFPTFSPDGTMVVYIVNAPLVERGWMFLVSVNGGSPRPFLPEFFIPPSGTTKSAPLWSADGKYIFFDGMRGPVPATRDWYMAPLDGGEPTRISAPPKRASNAVRLIVGWRDSYIYYAEGTAIGGMGIYRVALAQNPWRTSGKPEQLAQPTGMLIGASVSSEGRIVFSSVEPSVNIWSMDLQANQGIASGQMQAVTMDSENKLALSASVRSSRIAWVAFAPPTISIRIRDLVSGREEQVSGTGPYNSPRLSADGNLLAYGSSAGRKMTSFVQAVGSPVARQVCQDCMVRDFFTDPNDVLVDLGDTVVKQNLATGKSVTLMETPKLETMHMTLSPGDHWIAFTMARPNLTTGLYVSPVTAPPTRQETWTLIDEDRNNLGSPAWSPDGNLLYYISNRDGFRCTWAQRIGSNGKPDGAPFAVHHMHKTSLSTELMGTAFMMGVTQDKLYMVLAEGKGSLWSFKLSR